ncbi:MAG: hypothetical protein A2Y62_05410 [Candidatus Fischerbacteria bacterium RBG_13_37_8]|uniref:NAD-dependent epimerase/dehydratase domain-containing protein n=1 Tax=Candidatus Fischerbacteria bacterium RBG_13_37_8 TaxID=1817863 RepID=A0A1F5VXN8_9BACT|nr:MAG: hypothetical protein A2Y62_05410 [Candidatus Fischerbacteria bacterium RBG_13_37_8]
MKILITGAGGFIGGHVAEKLAAMNYSVTAFSRQIPLFLADKNVEIISGDICRSADIKKAMEGADAIIHAAAMLAARSYDKEMIFKINYEATAQIMSYAEKIGVSKIVHISTGGVLGNIEHPPVDETAPYKPEDLYEESKMLAEKEVLDYAKKGLHAVVVRPTWSYGERDKRVFKLIKAIKERKMFKIGRCQNLQHPVYISDLVHGILLALEKGKKGSVYFIGGSELVTTDTVIDTIARLLSVKLFPFRFPLGVMKLIASIFDKVYKKYNKEAPFSEAKLGFFIKNRAFSINKAQTELGYNPEIHFEPGMAKTIEWYITQKWLIK